MDKITPRWKIGVLAPIIRIHQKDEAMAANQIGYGESLSRLVMQIDHLRANWIEDVVGLVELRGSNVVAEFKLQSRHVFNEFVLISYSHGIDPSGSDRAFVGPTDPFSGTQMRRKELVYINIGQLIQGRMNTYKWQHA